MDKQFKEFKSYNSVRVAENLDSWACTGFDDFPELKLRSMNLEDQIVDMYDFDSNFFINELSRNLSAFGLDQGNVMSDDDFI